MRAQARLVRSYAELFYSGGGALLFAPPAPRVSVFFGPLHYSEQGTRVKTSRDTEYWRTYLPKIGFGAWQNIRTSLLEIIASLPGWGFEQEADEARSTQ